MQGDFTSLFAQTHVTLRDFTTHTPTRWVGQIYHFPGKKQLFFSIWKGSERENRHKEKKNRKID